MGRRDVALTTAMRAASVFDSTRAMERIEQDGYTRVDPFRIAEAEGIQVLLRPMDKLLGAFIRDETPGILLNALRPAGLVHMTCAHELGHYFMGHSSAVDETIDYDANAELQEQEAEWFGYHLLVPRPLLTIICRRKGWNKQSLVNPHILYQLALRLGVSYSAAAWSLLRHNLTDYDTVQRLLKTTPAMIKKFLLQGPLEDSTKDVWLFDDADRSSVLEPRPDDYMVVRLKSHASAGFLWQADSIEELESHGFAVAPLVASKVERDSLSFGADTLMDYLVEGGRERYDIPLPIQLSEVRPWLGKQEGDATFRSQAHFEPIAEGLSRNAKQAILQEAAEP